MLPGGRTNTQKSGISTFNICLILVHKGYSIATDSFDISLVYEDSKYNQAHKVVLATLSA